MASLSALPAAFAAGTTVSYTRSYPDYPADDGWALTLHLAGAATLSATAAAAGSGYVITIAAAASADLAAGLYRWVERVIKAGESYDVATGTVEVTPNFAAAGPGDLQSWEEKLLAVVQAAIAALISGKVQSYQIGTRAVTYADLAELKRTCAELQSAVSRQRNRGRLGRTHLVTFRGAGS